MEAEAARLDPGPDRGLGRGALRAQLGHRDTALRWVLSQYNMIHLDLQDHAPTSW